jgi:hypothetical protein
MTGIDGLDKVLDAIDLGHQVGLKAKINTTHRKYLWYGRHLRIEFGL